MKRRLEDDYVVTKISPRVYTDRDLLPRRRRIHLPGIAEAVIVALLMLIVVATFCAAANPHRVGEIVAWVIR